MIEHIFIRSVRGEPQTERDRVEVVTGAGIRGDRYFDAHKEPGQNITFVEAEAIEAFATHNGLSVHASATGRNIVTRGVRLNELVGRMFTVGELTFRGVELCEPCGSLGKKLTTSTLSPADVVRQWVHRAGLRADALTTGTLEVGALFHVLPEIHAEALTESPTDG